MRNFTEINWKAVGLAALAAFILGNIWFHPAVFGLTWANAAGVELKMTVMAFLGTVVMNIILAVGIAYVLRATGKSGVGDGVLIGLVALIAFVLPAIVGQWIFMDKFTLFAVNFSFNLVCLLMAGGIIGAMQKVQE